MPTDGYTLLAILLLAALAIFLLRRSHRSSPFHTRTFDSAIVSQPRIISNPKWNSLTPVSYTHLTLPTIYSV